MKLLLPPKIIRRVRRELRGRWREIGGVLVGEHVGTDTFRIVDFSVQRKGGLSRISFAILNMLAPFLLISLRAQDKTTQNSITSGSGTRTHHFNRSPAERISRLCTRLWMILTSEPILQC